MNSTRTEDLVLGWPEGDPNFNRHGELKVGFSFDYATQTPPPPTNGIFYTRIKGIILCLQKHCLQKVTIGVIPLRNVSNSMVYRGNVFDSCPAHNWRRTRVSLITPVMRCTKHSVFADIMEGTGGLGSP